jgi:hypothetical protein
MPKSNAEEEKSSLKVNVLVRVLKKVSMCYLSLSFLLYLIQSL